MSLEQGAFSKKHNFGKKYIKKTMNKILYDDDFAYDLKNAADSLSCKNNIEVDLGMDSELGATVSIDKTRYFGDSYDGNIEELRNSLKAFLASVSSSNHESINRISDFIADRLNSIFLVQDKEYLWIYIVAFSGTKEAAYKWHTDVSFGHDALGKGKHGGRELDYHEKIFDVKSYFTLFTLKGPSTLFYDLPSNLREKFARYFKENNQQKTNSLIDENLIKEGKPGKAYIILNGVWHGCVHSSPPKIQGERLFVAAGGATENEKQYLETKFMHQSSSSVAALVHK